EKSPTSSYLDPSNPIVITHFGQTHGYESRRFIAEELKLPFLSKSMIVQVELDDLSATAKRELLSSTRDRLKKGAFYRHLMNQISEALVDDERLDELNTVRKEALLSRSSKAEQEKLKRRFAELMDRL